MKSVKTSEERKNEILNISNELFTKNGYENTSIVNILDKVGIAKGTLYYYFKSKEEIMNTIIETYTNKIFERATKFAEDNSLSVYEKIFSVIMSLNIEDDTSGKEIIKHIHKPENVLMHKKQFDAIVNGITPILTKIICEGIDKGLFHTDYPYETVEMILIYTQTVFNDSNNLAVEETANRFSAFIINLERLLGAEPGSFDFIKELFN